METWLALMLEAWAAETPTYWRDLSRTLRDALVAYACARVPYWRPFTGVAFDELPVSTRRLMREHAADLRAEGVPGERVVEKTTSGSTGDPLRFWKDLWAGPVEQAGETFLKLVHHIPLDASEVLLTSRGRPGEPQRWPPPIVETLLTRRGPRTLRFSTLDLRPERVRSMVRAWRHLGPYYLYGHSSALAHIAGVVEGEGLPLPHPPIAAVATSDTPTVAGHQAVARAFRCHVHAWYGSHELDGFVAGTIDGSLRYACNPFLSYVEVLDDDGRRVPAGQVGRLVVTDLHNRVMPFIRYDTGDAAVLADSSHGGFPVLERIDGRSGEFIQLASGRVINAASIGQALIVIDDRLEHVIGEWQCAQVAPDHLELRVRWRGTPDADAQSRVQAQLERFAGADTRISVRGVDALETLPSGKRWLVRPLHGIDRDHETP